MSDYLQDAGDGLPGKRVEFSWSSPIEGAPVLLRFGGVLLVNPPEYFCAGCGGLYYVHGLEAPRKCGFCKSESITVALANSESLHALQRAWRMSGRVSDGQ